MSSSIIGGIEGGATHSHAVIMNMSGKIIGSASGPGTNHHLLGMKECRKRIAELVDKSKTAAGISTDIPLHALTKLNFVKRNQIDTKTPFYNNFKSYNGDAAANICLIRIGNEYFPGLRLKYLFSDGKFCSWVGVMWNRKKQELKGIGKGLSLSGCEQEETNQELVNGLIDNYPNLAKRYIVGSDTEGSVAATSNNGGVTCIAGTGSNTLLINPDRSRTQCGGWGYLLADEGSAYRISYRAVKYCFDELDNFEKPPYPTERVWNLVKEHFKIKTQADILDSFYKNFDKAFIASLCKKLSQLARDNDELSQSIFTEGGTHIARNICAVLPKAASELTNREGGIHILCVGSVWLSWDLLRPGFINWIEKQTSTKEMSLMKLNTEMGVGAVLMAADRLDLPLERDYSKNYTVFYRYKRGISTINNGTI